MADKKTAIVRGKAYWAKVIGEPRLNTYTNEREWAIDVTPDADQLPKIKGLGIKDRLKEPKDTDKERTEEFLTFRQREYRENRLTGERTKNYPIKIVDIEGQPWGDKLIGNGSIVDVKFDVANYGAGKPKGVYVKAIRVLQLVTFDKQEFEPLSEDDAFFAGTSDNPADSAPSSTNTEDFVKEEDLDDEIPF